jgi:hypothetical protein
MVRGGPGGVNASMRHPNRDTTNATDRFLGLIADKSLVMWTMACDGDGDVATATVALRTL